MVGLERKGQSGRLFGGEHDGFVTDWWGRVEEDRAGARSHCFSLMRHKVLGGGLWWVEGMLLGHHAGFIFVSSPTMAPESGGHLVAGSGCGGGPDLYPQKWVMGADNILWGWGPWRILEQLP